MKLIIRAAFTLVAIWLALSLANAASMTCHAVEGDRITAGDIAQALPVFGAIAADTPFGYAPQPGAYRNVEPAELSRFAAAHGLEFHSLDTVCFEPALSELDPSAVEMAVRESLNTLGFSDADIEIVEVSKFRVPAGKLTFPVDTFPTYSRDNTATWNGFVENERRRYPVWARVKIQAAQTRVVAVAELRAGQTIRANDIRLEEAHVFPSRAAALKATSESVGMLARRYINAGTPLNAGDLMSPFDVSRGEIVTVQIQSGAATLTVDAEAQSDGRAGQMIPFRNASSGKTFSARITGKRRALLECHTTGA